MIKDKTILELLENLKQKLDFSHLKIVDHWDADLCAIGIQKDNRLIYISTWNNSNESEQKYDYDLELIDESDLSKINVIKEGREVSENELIHQMKLFWEINSFQS